MMSSREYLLIARCIKDEMRRSNNAMRLGEPGREDIAEARLRNVQDNLATMLAQNGNIFFDKAKWDAVFEEQPEAETTRPRLTFENGTWVASNGYVLYQSDMSLAETGAFDMCFSVSCQACDAYNEYRIFLGMDPL